MVVVTVQAVFSADKEPDLQVVLDRNYLTDVVTVTVRSYDAAVVVAVPLEQFRKLNSMIGL